MEPSAPAQQTLSPKQWGIGALALGSTLWLGSVFAKRFVPPSWQPATALAGRITLLTCVGYGVWKLARKERAEPFATLELEDEEEPVSLEDLSTACNDPNVPYSAIWPTRHREIALAVKEGKQGEYFPNLKAKFLAEFEANITASMWAIESCFDRERPSSFLALGVTTDETAEGIRRVKEKQKWLFDIEPSWQGALRDKSLDGVRVCLVKQIECDKAQVVQQLVSCRPDKIVFFLEIARLLLGLSPIQEDNTRDDVQQWRSVFNNCTPINIEMLKLLMEFEEFKVDADLACRMATSNDCLKPFQWLLRRQHIQPNQCDQSGRSLLEIATQKRADKIVEQLLKDPRTPIREDLLAQAIHSSEPKVVGHLLASPRITFSIDETIIPKINYSVLAVLAQDNRFNPNVKVDGEFLIFKVMMAGSDLSARIAQGLWNNPKMNRNIRHSMGRTPQEFARTYLKTTL